MNAEELENKLQSVLFKYNLRDGVDVPSALSDDDAEVIKMALYESAHLLNDPGKISTHLKRLLIQGSMAVVDNEVRTLFMKRENIQEICYRFVNNYSSLNDLIVSAIENREAVSNTLGLPLEDFNALLKQDYETRVRLIELSGNKFFSHGLLSFLTIYPKMSDLCSAAWNGLSTKMTELNVTEDEQRDVMRCLWGQYTEFRKTLCENDFTGESIDELESRGGVRYLETLSDSGRDELKERYELTERQLVVLDALATANVPNEGVKASAAGSDRESKRQRLIDLITKVVRDLTLIGNGCNVQSVNELNELCDILHWKRELVTNANVIQPIKLTLDYALQILQVKQNDDRTEKNQDLIAKVDDGSVLHGLCLGLDKEDWCCKAQSPLLLKPDGCIRLTEIESVCIMKTFCFADKSEARKFEKAVLEMGLSAADSFSSQFESCFETKFNETCQSVIMLCFRSYPMASFRLEDKRHLRLTSTARESLIDVRGNETAAGFLEKFGSHVLSDAQQLGGMTCHSVEVVLPTHETKASLRELAQNLLERGSNEFLFLPNSTRTVNMGCAMPDGKTVNVTCVYQTRLRGLQIAQPQLYGEIIKHFNLQRSVLIERNVSKASLYGVWQWIADKMPDMKQRSDLLRNAWLRKAKRCETVDIVASELRKTTQHIDDELVGTTEEQMESLLADLARFDVNSAIEDESQLLETLRRFFASVQQYKQIADEEGLANPWVTYVAKRQEFKRFLVSFSQTYWNNANNRHQRDQATAFELKESLALLSETLNDDRISCAFKKALWAHDAKIKEMLDAAATSAKSSPAESQAFNRRLSQVTIENLVETLNAQLRESCLTEASSLSTVQWRVSLLLKHALLVQSDVQWRPVIEDLLVKSYGWRDGTFDNNLTADALLSLATSIERAMIPQRHDDASANAKMGSVRLTDDDSKPARGAAAESASATQTVPIKSEPSAQQQSSRKSFNPRDPARTDRARQSASRNNKRRPLFEFLVDFPPVVNCDSDTLKRRELARRLRNRTDLSKSLNCTDDDDQQREAGLFGAPKVDNHGAWWSSHYETLCELIDEYDPNGICEIQQLLLESRYTLPLFNPLTGEHYLKLLREVSVSIGSNKLPIRLGDDVTLPRVALISCRDPAESQLHEILRSVFHVNTLHANDVADETFTDQALTIDLGIGHLEQKKGNETSQHQQQNGQDCQGPSREVLVVQVTGDYIPAMDFLKDFADLLIIEDEPSTRSTSGASAFCSFVSEMRLQDSLESGFHEVLRWTPTSGKTYTANRDDNLEQHGFSHLSVSAPSGDKLFNAILIVSQATAAQNDQLKRNRKQLRSLDLLAPSGVTYAIGGMLPFDIDNGISESLKNVAATRASFLLQQNFRSQCQYEEKRVENRNDKSEREKAVKQIENCLAQRIKDANKVAKSPLLNYFHKLLQTPDPCVRVMAMRKFSQAVSTRTEIELQQVQKEIDESYSLVISMSANKSEKESLANKERYVKAKRNYQDTMLHVEHLWRELSHIYVTDPNKYTLLPHLAAQHLLDGFSIELLDGDANLLNLTWIQAVFLALQNKIAEGKSRIFVLSVMGVQSSGKSTLLNTMFGIKMRTSVGQCTRGINMQLLPVQGRPEYDYVLVLDTEGTRSPDFHGMEGNEKRDNQMATLSILLADATIIVNPGENDAATKEILPIVLMAYQGSKLAEDNGGRLSSMMFFVYNRIDTTQKEKLTNIIQTLAQSLLDAFKTVQELGGIVPHPGSSDSQQETNCLFRHFTLDTSNSSSSDVRILGQNKRSYEPPANVPDPKYGEALVEFREHIHKRVTQPRDSAAQHQWQSRSPLQLSSYLEGIWKCICSADFTLRFAHIVERTTFDQLEAEHQKCERLLASRYRSEFDKLHKEMLKDRWNAVNLSANMSAANERFEKFKRNLLDNVASTELTLSEQVNQSINRKGREKWKISYEQKWELFKSKQTDHWTRQIRYSFDTIYLFDSDIAKLKNDMRQLIREKVSKTSPNTLKTISTAQFENAFNGMIQTFSAEAARKYPPLIVKQEIDKVYTASPKIKMHKIDVINREVERQCKEIFMEHRGAANKDRYRETQQPAPSNETMRIGSRIYNWFASKIPYKSQHDQQQRPSVETYGLLFQRVHEKIQNLLEGVERFDTSIVAVAIDCTDEILKETFRGKTIEYTPRKYAHNYARVALTHYLEHVQANWEKHNSVAARFNEKANLDEMRDYFLLVIQGATKINVFRLHLEKKFENLAEAFESEMVCLTAQRVKEAKWLYEIKWTQNYMDRYLLQLIDDKKVTQLIHYVSNPNELFTDVMRRLIAQIAKDLLTGKGWRQFQDTLKNAIQLAADKAVSSKTNRAEMFVNELHTRLVDALKADVLPKRIELQFGGEYIALDKESDNDFRYACQESLVLLIDHQAEGSGNNEEFSRRVSDLVLKQLRAENQPGAMPRCELFCPWCKSTCTRKAGHDPKQQKHDAIHQPSGLGRVGVFPGNTLASTICSSYEDNDLMQHGLKIFQVKDWCKQYPDWEKPHPTQEWPLREYIFYHYHKEFAAHYGKKPCSDVPKSFDRSLSVIREVLKHGPIEF